MKKNLLVLDFDINRNPALILGKVGNVAVDTGGLPAAVADLNLILNALIVQMRALEVQGAKVGELTRKVIKSIENGVFDANLEIQCNKEK